MTLLYGLAVLVGLWWLAKLFAGANPAQLAKIVKKVGGVASMALAAFLLLRGRLDLAFLVGSFGAWLLGWAYSHPLAQWFRGLNNPFGQASAGQVSRVASAMLEMELEHDTGTMRGRVTGGAFAGRDLDSLGQPELSRLAAELAAADPEGSKLLEAYMDRRFAGRGEDAQPNPNTGSGGVGKPGAMTEQEAYDILGLQAGAGEEAVRLAHRNLIKRLHPDAGGSSALAARVNEAKDVLLKRHR
jgi:hypothetical protein